MSMYIGEALTGEGNEVAHIDLLIGDKAGPARRVGALRISLRGSKWLQSSVAQAWG